MPCPIAAGVVTRLGQTEEGSCDMRAARLDQILHEFRDGLERIYGCRLARGVLFGSPARDEAEPDSDIDVMLVLRGAVDPHKEVQRLSSFTSGLSLRGGPPGPRRTPRPPAGRPARGPAASEGGPPHIAPQNVGYLSRADTLILRFFWSRY